MKHFILLTTLLSVLFTSLCCAQSKETQKEKFQPYYSEVKALVKSKEYKFVGEVVYNNKSRSRVDATTNTLVINLDKVSGQLSSLDKAAKPMSLSGTITNYNVNFDDDSQQISIAFSLDEKNFYIDIKPNGNVFLAVKFGADNITQTGKIKSN